MMKFDTRDEALAYIDSLDAKNKRNVLDAAALRIRRVMRRTARIFDPTGVELRYDHDLAVFTFIRVELDDLFRERDLLSVDWNTARRLEEDMLVELVLERYPERFVRRPASMPMRYRPLDLRAVKEVADRWLNHWRHQAVVPNKLRKSER